MRGILRFIAHIVTKAYAVRMSGLPHAIGVSKSAPEEKIVEHT